MHRHLIIAPTVLATSAEEFVRRWRTIVPTAKHIQVDFMDGRFVPTTSIGRAAVPDVHERTVERHQEFEAHLMVREPSAWVPELLKKGFKRCIVHIETITPAQFRLLASTVHKSRGHLIAAINPRTNVRRLGPYLRAADGICVLGVRPGRNGAPYEPRTPQRVRMIRTLCTLAGRPLPIQVDGGMTPTTIRAVVRAGATRINSGSYVGNAPNPVTALRSLREAARRQVSA